MGFEGRKTIMIDIKLIRENKELVKENIKKKFQDEKLPLVDEIYDLDNEYRAIKLKCDTLGALKNKKSSEIGNLMQQGKKSEAEIIKAEVSSYGKELQELTLKQEQLEKSIKEKMMVIPNIIDDSVPIGENDTFNVEIEKFGAPIVPSYEIPYHADILASISGLDKESSARTSGNGFYYLMGDAARLCSAMLSYARDFMIDKGFTYCIPPFMIRGDVVNGVMSFDEMDAMMYKIEGEDLYLIGTSEHSMIGKFKNQIINEKDLPITLTSYSPCFRKEVGSHGIEERGIYRVHQFEKQEMVVLCKGEDAMDWYNKMWQFTVELFRSLDIPVRTLECCSGDLADLKVKSCDVEAWSPRQQKYFEVGSCSTLGDAQARRLGIRTKGENGTYYVNTLNNTVLASTRALIALLENNYNIDGSISIPSALQSYMGGKKVIIPNE
jgi:seryl-tRNA synthetase